MRLPPFGALAAALLPAVLVAQGTPVTKDARSSTTVAFVGVSVIPMDGDRVLDNYTVVVRDGRIAALGDRRTVTPPAGATVIEGRNRFLIPGLAEMHAHLLGPNAPVQLLHDILFLYVANGITTIRGMLGAPNQLALRAQTESGELLGPTILVAAPSLNGNSAPNPETAARLVREHKAAGYDLLKLHPGLTRPVYDTIVATARAVGITWGGHVSADVGLRHALATTQSTIDHLDGYLEAAISSPSGNLGINAAAVRALGAADPASMRELARATRQAGVWVVPTMYLWENFFRDVTTESMLALPEMKYAPSQMRTGWSNQKAQFRQGTAAAALTAQEAERFISARRAMLRELAQNGNRILMGTDSPQMFNVPGFALAHEIRVMREAGMTPYQILESGSRNVAEYVRTSLRGDAAFGTIAAGQRADLVLLEGNPLADLGQLERRVGVMVRGRWVPAEEIRRGLDAIAARNAQ
jgi:imidazolonepropionase-like amidohydrolase